MTNTRKNTLKIGILADMQYADKPTNTLLGRDYRSALAKTHEAVARFNREPDLDFVMVLGDLVDDSANDFAPVLDELDKLKHKYYIAVGNHDYKAINLDKIEVLNALRLKNTYYSFRAKGYRVIILDSNEGVREINGVPSRENADEVKYRKNHHELSYDLSAEHTWNGYIFAEQQKWLKAELARAKALSEQVLIFSHAPLFPLLPDMIINASDVLELVDQYRENIVGCFAGHHHLGAYGEFSRLSVSFPNIKSAPKERELKPIPCITFKGMVTANANAFSIVTVSDQNLNTTGFGRENSYCFKWK